MQQHLRRAPRLGLSALLAWSLAACGGSGSKPPEVPQTSPFLVSATGLEVGFYASATASDGAFFVGGLFEESVTLGAGEEQEITFVTPPGVNYGVMARYRADGALSWATAIRSSSGNSVNAVASLADGGCLVAGSYNDDCVFSPGTPAEVTLTDDDSAGDEFIARFDAQGVVAWARRIDGNGGVSLVAIATHADGGFTICGGFLQSVTLAVGEPEETTRVGGTGQVLLLARYSANGTLLWVRQVGPRGVAATDLATSADGSVLVSGSFSGTAVFGLGEPGETTLSADSPPDVDIFVARYGLDGSLTWVRSANGASGDTLRSIAARADGSCVITGRFFSSITFAEGEPGELTLSATSHGGFLAAFDAAGTLQWAQRIGDAASDASGMGVAMLPDGSFVVAGEFDGTTTFAEGTPQAKVLTSEGFGDVFVARHTSAGALLWIRQVGGPTTDRARRIDSFPDGSVLVAGSHNGALRFGPGDPDERTLPEPPSSTWAYAVRLGPNGGL